MVTVYVTLTVYTAFAYREPTLRNAVEDAVDSGATGVAAGREPQGALLQRAALRRLAEQTRNTLNILEDASRHVGSNVFKPSLLRQGDQRAARPREPSLHPQAVHPRHPRDAGRS